jgi:dihydrodipicolinate synthase/N-acetylneuraminate lyase
MREIWDTLGIAPAACSLKAALNMIGIAVGDPRLPYVPLDDSERAQIRTMLERHGLLTEAQTHA